MVEIAKITLAWTGFIGAPGFTNLYFRDFETSGLDQAIIDGSVAKVDSWSSSIQTRVPSSVVLQVQQVVPIIESTNGQIVRFMQATTAPVSRTGQGTGSYAAAAGACVNWYTDGVRNGRRVRGRSFIVPLAGSALASDGTIDNTQLTGLRSASTTMAAVGGTGDLGVWARPSGPGATDGEWHSVTSVTIPDKTAVLRSRRD